MMYESETTEYFDTWIHTLKDLRAQIAIARRIERAENGNFGDHKSVGENVSEMRLTLGPGYRIYYTIENNKLIVLLIGGDKSTQSKDIEKAKKLAKEYRDA